MQLSRPVGKVIDQAKLFLHKRLRVTSEMIDFEEAKLHLQHLAEALKKKDEDPEYGAPELVTIGHDEHRARHVGTTAGRQFFLTAPFDFDRETNVRREFIALYLFDSDGNLVEAKIDEFGPCDTHETQLIRNQWHDKCLAELGDVIFEDIAVKPFAVAKFDTAFGLIPLGRREKEEDEITWTVQFHPGNYMAFWEPWDSGEYDT